MILAVPMMVILKIVCENIEFLQPMSILMGSRAPEMRVPEDKDSTEAQA